MRQLIVLGIVLLGIAFPSHGASFYPARLEDPNAVYLTNPSATAKLTIARRSRPPSTKCRRPRRGDPLHSGRSLPGHRTIYVWPGVRLIGYGEKRPVFVLADNTPGYQQGIGYMFFFAGFRLTGGAVAALPRRSFRLPPPPPGTVPPTSIADANPGTFYSAMSNIDFEIGSDNAAAVGIRFHVAQHGYLAHMDFQIGSGLAALHDVGNEAEDLHFHGGRYGILTRKPSAAWQFTLIDSTFDGQREAAIRENEAGLTLVHDEFRNVPTAISIDAHYSDQLWVKDARFENISGPAILISNENSRMTQINLESIVCRQVPVFARFRESGRQLGRRRRDLPGEVLSHGLTLPAMGATGEIQTKYDAAPLKSLPPPTPDAIRGLPPIASWVNLRTLGAKGDGVTDETALIQKAIAEHRVLYIPSGRYVVSDTLRLRPDSVLIGLHPDQTQFDILDSTPGFQGPGAPRPLLEAPRGGDNIVTGIGLYTGGINTRAVGALWMAGKDSLMDDVRFLGGHGTNGPDGKRVNPYSANLARIRIPIGVGTGSIPACGSRMAAAVPSPISGLPTPSRSRASTSPTPALPAASTQLSSEHHVRTEIKLDQVANWELYALQTEGEREESAAAIALEIGRSKNITIANFHGYRVVRSYHPFPYAIRMQDSSDIRFRNVHVDSNSAMAMRRLRLPPDTRSSKVSYENCIVDQTLHAEVRDREFAWLDVSGKPAPATRRAPSPCSNRGRPGEAIDRFLQHLRRGSGCVRSTVFRGCALAPHLPMVAGVNELRIVRDNPLDPVNLVFDKAGNLIVVSSGGKGMTVYSFRPDGPEDEITVLEPEPAAERPGMTAVLPVNYWVNGDFTNTLSTETYEYVSLERCSPRS